MTTPVQTRATIDLAARHQAVLPQWVHTYYDTPLEIVAGAGVWVRDADGNRYLDAFGGILTTSVGHGVRELREAVDRQLRAGVVHTSTLYLIRGQVLLAERIAALSAIPDARVFFANSGSEANDTALMLAAARRPGGVMVALEGSYHGRGFAAVAVTHLPSWRPVTSTPFPVVFAPDGLSRDVGTHDRRPVDVCQEVLASRLDDHTQPPSALIFEPVQGVSGFREPPPGLVAAYAELVRQRGGIVITDEVQTGWGRTGSHWWGAQRHGVAPDLITFAKGLANGFAIGGVVGRGDVMDGLPANSISTFGGNPVATAAALATLDIVEAGGLQHNAEEAGRRLLTRLRDRLEGADGVAEVRGAGLMVAVELGESSAGRPDQHRARRVAEAARRNGLLVGLGGRHGSVIRIAPPLTITSDEVDEIANRLVAAVHGTASNAPPLDADPTMLNHPFPQPGEAQR